MVGHQQPEVDLLAGRLEPRQLLETGTQTTVELVADEEARGEDKDGGQVEVEEAEVGHAEERHTDTFRQMRTLKAGMRDGGEERRLTTAFKRRRVDSSSDFCERVLIF